MNRKTLFIVLSVILLLVFSCKIISDFYWAKGLNPESPNREKSFKISRNFFPLNSEVVFRHGLELLKKGNSKKDISVILKSNIELKKAVALNPLNFKAFLFLAKSYFLLNRINSSDFLDGLDALKKTAFLRKTNKIVALDLIKIMLSFWPHLNEEDRGFTIDVLNRISFKISSKEFKTLVDIWGLYSRDLKVFKSGLKPDFYQLLADEMAKNQIFKEKRHEYLVMYESFRMSYCKNIFEELKENTDLRLVEKLDKAVSLKKRLNSFIKGYSTFGKENSFDKNKFFHLKRDLSLFMIKHYFQLKDLKEKTDISENKIEDYLLNYIENCELNDNKIKLLTLLEKNNYFDKKSILSIYIKNLILFSANRDSEVIRNIEKFIGTVSFIEKKYMNNYTSLIKLLSQAYVKSRLLMRAMEVLMDINEKNPDQKDIYSRILRIEKVIGEDKSMDKDLRGKIDSIKESREIKLNSPVLKKDVYIIDNTELKIVIEDEMKKHFTNNHLLQVFMDGKLSYEEYLSNLENEILLTCKDKPMVSVLIKVKKVR